MLVETSFYAMLLALLGSHNGYNGDLIDMKFVLAVQAKHVPR